MDRPRATTQIARTAHRSAAGAGVAILPTRAVSPASLGSDPAALAVLAAAVVIATGAIIVLRGRSGDDGERTDVETAPGNQAADARGETDDRHSGDDRDHVRAILRAHGGRTRQTVIVEETEWSKAKVSAVLAEMNEDGDVSKLRVGRENIVSLPGHEPDAVDSPIED